MKEFFRIAYAFLEVVVIVLAVLGLIALVTLGLTYAPILTLLSMFGFAAFVIWLGTLL